MEHRVYEMVLDTEEEAPIFALSLVEQPAIEQNFVYLSKQEVKLAIQSEEKRLIVAPILVPDKLISRFDDAGEEYFITFPKQTVLRSAELYLSKNNTNNTTLEHAGMTDGVSLVQSWIVEDTLKDKSAIYNLALEPGTWAGVFRVDNEQVWADVKDGKFKGISIEGMFGHSLVKASQQYTSGSFTIDLPPLPVLEEIHNVFEENEYDKLVKQLKDIITNV